MGRYMFFVSGDDDDSSDDAWFLKATEKEKAIAEAKKFCAEYPHYKRFRVFEVNFVQELEQAFE